MNRLIVIAAALMSVTPLQHLARGAPPFAVETLRLTFSDEFDALDLRSPANPDGVWLTRFPYGGRTLSTNNESQYYVDPDYMDLRLNPFRVEDGVLTITAEPADPQLKPLIENRDYTSGVIVSKGAFHQQYGYFEMRARMPAGKGLWPAFWLMPIDGSWPPEIDVVEVLGHETDKLHTTLHTTAGRRNQGKTTRVPDMSKDFHTYGVDWRADTITFYFDRRPVAAFPTPADMHKPFYILANLAVGGNWPGYPDRTTKFPAAFEIDYIRVYANEDTIPESIQRPQAERRRHLTARAASSGAPSAAPPTESAAPTNWISGTRFVETLEGTDGNDRLRGAGGRDILKGGPGDDTYLVGDEEAVIEAPGEGIDTVQSWAPLYILPPNVENLIVANRDASGFGNELNNRIEVGRWGNTIGGRGGDDLLIGAAGPDTFVVHRGEGDDVIVNFGADDRVVLVGSHADFDAARPFIRQVGEDTVIRLGEDQVLTLRGVKRVTADQFSFISPAEPAG